MSKKFLTLIDTIDPLTKKPFKKMSSATIIRSNSIGTMSTQTSPPNSHQQDNMCLILAPANKTVKVSPQPCPADSSPSLSCQSVSSHVVPAPASKAAA